VHLIALERVTPLTHTKASARTAHALRGIP
jgi:hypothetical protein